MNSMFQFQLERGGDGTKRVSEDEVEATSSSWLNGKEVSRCGGMMTSAREEAALRRGKGGDDVSWFDVNFTWPKNE
jgi:hypothetical protein